MAVALQQTTFYPDCAQTMFLNTVFRNFKLSYDETVRLSVQYLNHDMQRLKCQHEVKARVLTF